MLIDARDIGRTFRRGEAPIRALDGVSLQVEEGEHVVVTGPSGCGKTTLLNVLGLLDAAHDGRLELLGRDASRLSPGARARIRLAEIGFVFQDFNLVHGLDVLDNVALPHWRLHGSRAGARRRAAELLDSLGVGALLSRDPRRLSGGEAQRVALARALVNAPRIVLADEPTANLDADATLRILEALAGARGGGRAVVVVSHNPVVAAGAGRVVRLEYGRIAAAG